MLHLRYRTNTRGASSGGAGEAHFPGTQVVPARVQNPPPARSTPVVRNRGVHLRRYSISRIPAIRKRDSNARCRGLKDEARQSRAGDY